MTVEAYAKINLTLEVLGKRPDGYHDLRSVVCPITLSDTLVLESSSFASSDTGYDDDLCLRSAAALGVGCAIHVEKNIPAGGGLGGGSADAAAVLLALNRMYGLGYDVESLAEKGAEVGSDVPALVLANAHFSPVIMEGRGERVRPISPIKLNFVLVNPRVHSSTKEIFSRWTSSSHSLNVTEIAEKALLTRDINLLASVISNDLKNAAVSLHSEIGEALEALKSENVLAASMTGSGSTIFALVSSSEEAIFIAERMKKRGYLAFSVSSL